MSKKIRLVLKRNKHHVFFPGMDTDSKMQNNLDIHSHTDTLILKDPDSCEFGHAVGITCPTKERSELPDSLQCVWLQILKDMSVRAVVDLYVNKEGLANYSSPNKQGTKPKSLIGPWGGKKTQQKLTPLPFAQHGYWMVRGQTFICVEKEHNIIPTTVKKWKEKCVCEEFGNCECCFLLQSSLIWNWSCSLLKAKRHKFPF